jgi:hypothetical protein
MPLRARLNQIDFGFEIPSTGEADSTLSQYGIKACLHVRSSCLQLNIRYQGGRVDVGQTGSRDRGLWTGDEK